MPSWICRIPFLKTSHYLHKFPIFTHISLLSFSTSTPEISLFDYLVDQHQFSQECAANVSSSSSTKYLNKPQNADSVLNFLKEIGFAKNQIEAVVQKVPRVLSVNLEKSIKPKIKVFQDLGFQSTDFANIISTCPWLLNSSADRLGHSFSRLKNVLGHNADICRFLKKYGTGRSLMCDLDRTLVPNIEYLKSCGTCSLQIPLLVCRTPTTFFRKPDKFKGIIQRVNEMGVDGESTMFVEGVKAMNSMSRKNWELKLKLFRDLGFSEQNILHNFKVAPQAFCVSERKIREVIELLLSVEDMSYIVTRPRLLSCSVEKKLKPRCKCLRPLRVRICLRKDLLWLIFF